MSEGAGLPRQPTKNPDGPKTHDVGIKMNGVFDIVSHSCRAVLHPCDRRGRLGRVRPIVVGRLLFMAIPVELARFVVGL